VNQRFDAVDERLDKPETKRDVFAGRRFSDARKNQTNRKMICGAGRSQPRKIKLSGAAQKRCSFAASAFRCFTARKTN
jgi:hypothetical protein